MAGRLSKFKIAGLIEADSWRADPVENIVVRLRVKFFLRETIGRTPGVNTSAGCIGIVFSSFYHGTRRRADTSIQPEADLIAGMLNRFALCRALAFSDCSDLRRAAVDHIVWIELVYDWDGDVVAFFKRVPVGKHNLPVGFIVRPMLVDRIIEKVGGVCTRCLRQTDLHPLNIAVTAGFRREQGIGHADFQVADIIVHVDADRQNGLFSRIGFVRNIPVVIFQIGGHLVVNLLVGIIGIPFQVQHIIPRNILVSIRDLEMRGCVTGVVHPILLRVFRGIQIERVLNDLEDDGIPLRIALRKTPLIMPCPPVLIRRTGDRILLFPPVRLPCGAVIIGIQQTEHDVCRSQIVAEILTV